MELYVYAFMAGMGENFYFFCFVLIFCKTCCLHLYSPTLGMEPADATAVSAPTYQRTQQHSQNTVTIICTDVRTQLSFYILLLAQNLPRFLASFFKPFLFSRLPILSKLPPETQCNICRGERLTTDAIPYYSFLISLLPTDWAMCES